MGVSHSSSGRRIVRYNCCTCVNDPVTKMARPKWARSGYDRLTNAPMRTRVARLHQGNMGCSGPRLGRAERFDFLVCARKLILFLVVKPLMFDVDFYAAEG